MQQWSQSIHGYSLCFLYVKFVNFRPETTKTYKNVVWWLIVAVNWWIGGRNVSPIDIERLTALTKFVFAQIRCVRTDLEESNQIFVKTPTKCGLCYFKNQAEISYYFQMVNLIIPKYITFIYQIRIYNQVYKLHQSWKSRNNNLNTFLIYYYIYFYSISYMFNACEITKIYQKILII